MAAVKLGRAASPAKAFLFGGKDTPLNSSRSNTHTAATCSSSSITGKRSRVRAGQAVGSSHLLDAAAAAAAAARGIMLNSSCSSDKVSQQCQGTGVAAAAGSTDGREGCAAGDTPHTPAAAAVDGPGGQVSPPAEAPAPAAAVGAAAVVASTACGGGGRSQREVLAAEARAAIAAAVEPVKQQLKHRAALVR